MNIVLVIPMLNFKINISCIVYTFIAVSRSGWWGMKNALSKYIDYNHVQQLLCDWEAEFITYWISLNFVLNFLAV